MLKNKFLITNPTFVCLLLLLHKLRIALHIASSPGWVTLRSDNCMSEALKTQSTSKQTQKHVMNQCWFQNPNDGTWKNPAIGTSHHRRTPTTHLHSGVFQLPGR